MKTARSNPKQIARNIAVILKHNPKKVDQLKKVGDICCHLTSDDGISVDWEYYGGGLVRYLITGTRCGMTVTANAITNEIQRKPRGARPVFIGWEHINVGDILNILEEIQRFDS